MAPDHAAPRVEDTPRLVEKRCPLHNVPLKEKTVSIAYGYVMDDLVEGLVAPIFFPYAHTIVYSGCCMPGPEEEAQVFYCDVCCEARRQWKGVEGSIADLLKS
jgi:hypothetical protein